LSYDQINPDVTQKINKMLYWKCQLIGWACAAAFWEVNAFLDGGFNLSIGLVHFILDVVIGIGITHAYRSFVVVRGWLRLDLKQLAWRIIPAILLTGLAYMAAESVKNYGIRVGADRHFAQPFTGFLRQNFLILTATGIRLMAIWILAFHLYHYALLQIKTSTENARLLLIAKEAELNNLSSQLNPHFFFNSINTIKALVASDPDKARRAIDLLSELLRTSLYHRDRLLIPLSEETDLVSDYLELEKIRFENRLCYDICVDKSLADRHLLPLSIQTLAENAIKHGIAKYTGGGLVNIKVEKKAGLIKVTVQNPGLLDINDRANGLGLGNLRDRLALQYGDQASLTLRQLPGEIVSAVMLIPDL